MTNKIYKSLSLTLGSILILHIILSIPSFWVPFYKVDELTNAIYARLIVNHELSLKDFLGSTYFFTHYFYALIFRLIDNNSLIPVHIAHCLWKCGTITGLYLAGSELKDKKTGLYAALFYTVYNWCFMSKDFHTPSAESLSLLPASFTAYFLFKGLRLSQPYLFFITGIFCGMAALFKAPMGITLVALNLVFIFYHQNRIKSFLLLNIGFILTYLSPTIFYGDVVEGFKIVFATLYDTKTAYMSYHKDSFIYWGIKFLLRTMLIFASTFGMSFLAVYAIRFLFKNKNKNSQWIHVWFLTLWLLFLWYDATLGKRIFFYYFKFMLVPLSLMAALSITSLDHITKNTTFSFKTSRFIKKHLAYFMLIPLIGFSVEGAFNFSTKAVIPFNFTPAIDYIKSTTKPDDKIFVWGYIPQLYFYTNREPASTFFWSDVLAGSSPGSPAMEYIHATGNNLTLSEKLTKDMVPFSFSEEEAEKIDHHSLSKVSDNDLFTVNELLGRIDNDHWKKVFDDFFKHPPVLFIDTAPLNYRGFGYYPISNYELLKRFIADNYVYDSTVSGMPIYRLKNNL
ncbi:glycosyltransferase family 39 protein [bacterium]|nr:glycosyltransferase family 39 protein [bacterium]